MRKEKVAIKRFLLWQLLATLCLTGLVAISWSSHAALSTFFGGLLAIVPTVFLSAYLFLRPRSIYYVGEALKLLITGALLVLILHFYAASLAPLLLGLLGTYAVYFFSGCLIR